MLKAVINNREIEFQRGDSILKAARLAGIETP